jgi:hypothetical protein
MDEKRPMLMFIIDQRSGEHMCLAVKQPEAGSAWSVGGPLSTGRQLREFFAGAGADADFVLWTGHTPPGWRDGDAP